MNKNIIKLLLNVLLLTVSVQICFSTIYIKSMPLRLIKWNETAIAENTDPNQKIALEWLGDNYGPPPQNCEIRYRTSPGNQISDYTLGPISQTVQGQLLDFNPQKRAANGMTGGVYYCRVVEVGNINNFSEEFIFYVESSQAPQMLTPVNGTYITNPKPIFTWNGVIGVPFYYIIVTDQKIIIEYNPNTGENEIKTQDGLPIMPVWQSITPETNISYGTPDSSGYFIGNPEPLLANTTYTWVVFNCYANNPAYVSSVVSGLFEFCFVQQVNLPKPTLISPPNNKTTDITDPVINFTWNDNWTPSYDPISNFHIYIYRETAATSTLGFGLLSFDGSTTNTYFDLNAFNILSNAVYYWRIITEDSQGRAIKSSTWAFKYYKLCGQLEIKTQFYNPTTSNIEDLGYTNIFIDAINGGSIITVPLITDTTGNLIIDLSPGTYRITAEKENFESQIATTTIIEQTTTYLNLILEKSPSHVIGTVIDDNSVPVFNAVANFIQKTTPYETKFTVTDNNGIFRMNVYTNTSWDISVTKIGYSTSSVITVNLSSYPTTVDVGQVIIIKNKNIITGTVVNELGYAIVSAEVKVKSDTVEWTTLSDSNGGFTFKVNDGTWILSATKIGFISPTPITIVVSNGETVTRQIVLKSQANRVTGYVTDNQQYIKNATVEALDLSGQLKDTTLTDIYGYYTLNLNANQTYNISASKSGYTSPPSQQVTFGPTDSGVTISGINFVLTPNISYITGKVTTDGINGLANVTITNGSVNTLTNSDGTYTLNVAYGNHTIEAIKEGYTSEPAQQQITIGPGETISNVNFILIPNASVIKGTVYSDTGQKVYQATVLVSSAPSGQPLYNTLTDSSGQYMFSINYGTWYLKAKKDKFIDSSEISVSVAPGQTSIGNDLVITLNIGYMTGVVRDSSTVVREATVKIYNGINIIESGVTDINGRYNFALEPSTYSIKIDKTGYKTYFSTRNYTVLFGTITTVPDIILEKTVYYINGTVTGPSNSLIKDAEVNINGNVVLTDINGYFCSGVNEGIYNVFVTKKGYKSVTSTQTITFVAGVDPDGTIKSANFIMDYNYGILKGLVTTGNGSVNIKGAIVNANGNTTTTLSNGTYSLTLIPGNYSVAITSTGYITYSTFTYINDGSTTTVNCDLIPAKYSITGNVVNNLGSGIENATVKVSNELVTKNSVTNSSGNFSVSELTNGSYNITVVKTGYSFVSGSNTIIINNSDIYGLNFVLAIDSATIEVNVYNNETNNPVTGASILVTGETQETLGYSGNGISDINGNCVITNLKSGIYTLKITVPNYKIKISSGIHTGTINNIGLDKLYGTISGTVTNEGSGFKHVTVTAISLTNSSIVKSTVTKNDGTYLLDKLAPDNYSVSASKISYLSSPPSVEVNIPGGYTETNITGINFTLFYSTVTQFELLPPTQQIISNINETYQFSFYTKDSQGRQVYSYPPIWSITPVISGTITPTGLYIPNKNYLGTIKIIADIPVFNKHIEVTQSVYYKIYPSSNNAEIYGNDNLKLFIPKFVTKHQSINEDKITLVTEDVTLAKYVSELYTPCSKLYNLKPDSFKFSDSIKIYIPITQNYNRKYLCVGRWDNSKVNWIPYDSKIEQDYCYTNIDHFSEYVLLIKSKELGVDSVTILPNPFSPKIKPVTISYYPTSIVSNKVNVTLKIYNMIGDLVKILVDNEFQNIGIIQEIQWDGKNNDGQLCLNGRYIAEFTVEDGTGIKSIAKTFVLIK